MRDPFGSFPNMMSQFKGFMSNPMQMMRGLNIPPNMNSPTQIIQYLMDSGRLSQQDYNTANSFYRKAQNNPLFGQFMNRQ